METMITWIITGVTLVPMLIISLVLLSGRGAFLVAGYNTMKPSEQAQWNEKAMCRFLGGLLLGFTLVLAVAMVSLIFLNVVLFLVFVALGVTGLLMGVLYLNMSGRFKNI